jgi:hypothetical protein
MGHVVQHIQHIAYADVSFFYRFSLVLSSVRLIKAGEGCQAAVLTCTALTYGSCNFGCKILS